MSDALRALSEWITSTTVDFGGKSGNSGKSPEKPALFSYHQNFPSGKSGKNNADRITTLTTPESAVVREKSPKSRDLTTLTTLTTKNDNVGSAPTFAAETEPPVQPDEWGVCSPLATALAALEHRCPDHIQATDWQRAVEDGRRFLIQWGEQATALGWAEHDIFGLPPVPPDPHPSWQRLARVDQLGLVWLTHGRPVTSITAESATIATPKGGSVAFYRLQARQEPQKTIAGDTGGPAISSPVVHADEAAKPASYEVLGPAPLGRRCVVCNIVGLGPQLIRHDGRVDVMHPACAKKAFKPKEAP